MIVAEGISVRGIEELVAVGEVGAGAGVDRLGELRVLEASGEQVCVFAGNGLQIFMWSMGAYAIPYVVTTSPASIDLISIEIGRDLESSVFGVERAATLAVILMLLAIAMMWIYRTLQRRGERIL